MRRITPSPVRFCSKRSLNRSGFRPLSERHINVSQYFLTVQAEPSSRFTSLPLEISGSATP